MLVPDLALSMANEHDDSGRWGLSVATHATQPIEAIVDLYFKRNPDAPRRKMRVTSVGAVKGSGFDVIRSGRIPHGLILAAHEPTEDEWNTLVAVFGPPQQVAPAPKVGGGN